MSNTVLILGDTGSGKSRAIKGLNPKETVVINVIGKSLPWRGWQNDYKKYNKETKEGNIWDTRNVESILKIFKEVSDNRPEVKNIIVDDFQYTLSFEYLERAQERSYDKFNDIGQNTYFMLTRSKTLRDDLTVFFLSHIEQGVDAYGATKTKIKTVGKLVDDKITPEGLFTIVLLAQQQRTLEGIKYGFVTNSDGTNTSKSPEEMFEDFIPNDLQYVKQKIHEYNTGVENADTTK
uniref:Putative ATPase domain containing protein n=1 Tax=viral metagenome TaxID=1070528 RepID=A0A6H2A4P4_9ZZZZ